jgi:hypothetical protein
VGEKGTEEGVRGEEVVLDAGGLIALERANEAVAALIANAARLQVDFIVPATALAQVWRGGPRSAHLARVISNARTDPLDEARAKEVGERLGDRGQTDIADAHVVCCTLDRNAVVVTSDRDDIEALTRPDENLTLVSV